MTDLDLRVGDSILVKASVVEVAPGVGVRVELFSKTDQYTAWIRTDHVDQLVLPDAGDEPGDGTWLECLTDCGDPNVFFRNDGQGPKDQPVRRFDRHWWDVAGMQWVDWPTAIRRGADPARRLAAATT